MEEKIANVLLANYRLKVIAIMCVFMTVVLIGIIFLMYAQNVKLRKDLYDANYRNNACELLYDNGYRTTQSYDWSKI